MENIFLVKKAIQGDLDAFATLYEGIYEKLYRYALYLLRNPEDAKEAVSDTVTDAFASIQQLKEEKNFNAWMFKILSNKCRKLMQEFYTTKVPFEDVDLEDPHVFYEENIDLQKSFQKLDPQDQEIILLHVLQGYKTREIAEILNLNQNTVRSREMRALNKLKEDLA